MARQNRTKSNAASTEAPTTNTEENVVTATDTEAPVEVTETEAQADTSTEAPAAEVEAPAETPIDLTAFKAAVESAMSEADTSTGEIPPTGIEAVNKEYRALDGQKPKNEARKFLDESMLDAVGKLDAVKARGFNDLRANLSAGGGASKSERTPADPTAAFVQRVAALRLALQVVEAEAPEVEGLDDKIDEVVNGAQDSVTAMREYLANTAEDKGDAPEVSPVVRQAFKLASGKGTGGGRSTGTSHSGPRGNVAKHIASAFADAEEGTFLTIAEIVKHASDEYPSGAVSAGAVSARLFPASGNCTVEGVEPVDKGAIDGKNPKGARKVA